MIITSAAVAFTSALCIIAVSYLEHLRSPRPSSLLNLYLLLTVLLDAARTRTLWLVSLNSDENIFSYLFTVAVVLQTVLLLLELKRKSDWIDWDAKTHSPEETAGIFGLGAFVWLNSLFLAGYKEILTIDRLFPLDQSMTTEVVQLSLMKYMRKSRSEGRKPNLAKALARSLILSILLPIVPRIALIGFRFCQPFLITSLLAYLQRPVEDLPKQYGYGLIGAAILIYTGIALSNALYWYIHERTLCMFQGALSGAVFTRTTEMKLSTDGDSAAITLMSADVERIRLGFLNLHEFWANSIEAGLASWLVQRQLGAAFVAPLLVVLFCITCANLVI